MILAHLFLDEIHVVNLIYAAAFVSYAPDIQSVKSCPLGGRVVSTGLFVFDA